MGETGTGLPYRPGLDGLRGVAVLLVVAYHLDVPWLARGGAYGVDVFFALSGFLITAILTGEHLDGRWSIRAFYARRAARLLPALVVLLAVWVVVLLAAHDRHWLAATPATGPRGVPVEVGPALGDVALALAYLGNWVHAFGVGHAPIGHLWSLAVEEQFYLAWPLALGLLLRLGLRGAQRAVLALAAVSAALAFAYWDGGAGFGRVYFGTDTRVVGLLAGAAAALAWQRRRLAGGAPPRTLAARAALGAAALAYLAVDRSPVRGFAVVAPAVTAVAAVQLVVLLVERPNGRATRLLARRPLLWVGRRSYGLYLWHYLFATWLHPVGGPGRVPLTLAASFAATAVSWALVERPFLAARARDCRVPDRHRAEPALAFAATPTAKEPP